MDLPGSARVGNWMAAGKNPGDWKAGGGVAFQLGLLGQSWRLRAFFRQRTRVHSKGWNFTPPHPIGILESLIPSLLWVP